MSRLVQVVKIYRVESELLTLVKRIPVLLKLMIGEVGLFVGGIGGLIIGSVLILAGLFTLFAICAFVNYGIGCFF